MRDINRIDEFLETFEKLWKKHPDLRFYQLIDIINYLMEYDKGNIDPFYVEDDEYLDFIRNLNLG